MKKMFFGLMFLAIQCPIMAQNGYDAVLSQIEANSTTLQALRAQMEAQKLENRTGLFLSNPEVEFNYLWGNPSAIGNRTDFAVSQSFDFPTAYVHRNQIAKLANSNVELAYKAERINLLLQAKKTCIELIYCNALAKEYDLRLQNAKQIAFAYQMKFEKGEANVLEKNKAQMNLTTVENEVTRIQTERIALLSELNLLNGGRDIDFTLYQFPESTLPANFDDWFSQAEAKNPTLQYISGQLRASEEQIKLNRAMGLPKFHAGYMSEKVIGERYQGVSVGVSIPLWENKNRIKQARAQMRADETLLNDTKVQFFNKLQILYNKASNLQQSASKYRSALSSFNNDVLLKKALDKGEISLLDYLMEIEYYYDAVNSTLDTEKNFELSLAELSAVEL